MLRRITLENFMSHQHTVIDLADGLTVLTGPNNCGKSAVVAALQILASNGKTTHVMRHGAKTAKITAETDDGHVICWQRKKASVSYTLDGEDIHRVGQKIPDGLHELLRMPIVEADAGKQKVSYDIHFGEQKSPVFLLGDPGSRAASFFAAASDASRLLEMTVKHRSNVKDTRQDAKRLTAELETCDKELSRLKPVEQIEVQLKQAELQFADISKTIDDVKRLASVRDGITGATAECKTWNSELETLRNLTAPPTLHDSAGLATLMTDLSQVAAVKSAALTAIEASCSLKAPPELHETSDCERLLEQLKSTAVRAASLTDEATAFQQLDSPPAVHPTADLDRIISDLRDASNHSHRATREAESLSVLEPPKQQHDTSTLQQTITELKSRQQQRASAATAAKRLKALAAPTENSDTAALQAMVKDLSAVTTSRQELKNDVERCRKLLSECEMRVQQFVKNHPRCETCGAKLETTQLLSAVPGVEGHGHA